MTPDQQVGYLLLGACLIVLGRVIVRGLAGAWSERRETRLAQEQKDTLLAVEYFARVRELPDPDWSGPEDVEAHIASSLALVRERMEQNVIQFPERLPNGYRNVTRLPRSGA